MHDIAHHSHQHMVSVGHMNTGAHWSHAVPAGWLQRLTNFKSLCCKCLCLLSLSSLPAGKEALPSFVTVCVCVLILSGGHSVSRRKDAAAHTGCMGQLSSHGREHGNIYTSTVAEAWVCVEQDPIGPRRCCQISMRTWVWISLATVKSQAQ